MPRLTANYSESLAKLLRSGEVSIDGVEVGPWMPIEKILSLREEFPNLRVQFHAGSFISRYKYWPGALKQLSKYHSCTQSEWVSVHIELLHIWTFLMSSRFGIHMKPPNEEHAKNNFVRILGKLKDNVEMPIILENLPSLHQEKYAYAAAPSAITEIIRATDSGLLLDISHARIASSYQKISVENYLEKLPLDRTIQVHVSGARKINGYLQDVHEPMQEEDYEILKWVLGKTKPKVITLEYFRDTDPLREQLRKLREIL